MKNRGKRTAFLAALLAMSMLLSACGSSGSNTGVWIAIIIMVFIAVFAATSGVVYLVLQRVLPPEEESKPQSVRPVQRRNEEIDDVTRRPPLRASTQRTQASAQNRSAEWICPRDHTRNTGPYCTACGDSRPQRQTASQPVRTAQSAAQTTRRTEETRYASQNRQSYASTPTGTAQTRPSAAGTQTRTQTASTAGTAQARPQTASTAAQTRTQTAPAAGTTQARTQTAASQQERPYTGKFARKEPEPTPAAQTSDTSEEPEYDAELLAAIFREAEQGNGEE